MASYIEVRNANNAVVIDDQFSIAKFLYRDSVSTRSTQSSQSASDGPKYKYVNFAPLIRFNKPSDLGFIMPDGLDNTSPEALAYLKREIMVFARCNVTTAFMAKVEVMLSSNGDGVVRFDVKADLPDTPIEICLYTTAPMIPCKYGAQAFNAKGELVFDAMRGYLSHVGTMSGGVDISKYIAATYTFEVQGDLDPKNLFISFNSTIPYYSAYNIHSGGVSYGSTLFPPVMSFPSPNTLRVDLVKQNEVSGDNNKNSFSHYFENVIYCPYPSGVWITGK